MLEIPKSPSTTTASSGSRTPDERLTRYRIWLASFSTSYPSGVEGNEPWQVAVRFCYVLDCAATLLSDPHRRIRDRTIPSAARVGGATRRRRSESPLDALGLAHRWL